jgi:hypothetical protein
MTNHNDFTGEEKAMKHVITMGLMLLQVAAAAWKAGELDDEHEIVESVSKIEAMIAKDLNLPLKRVGELYRIVLSDLNEFSNLPPEIQEVLSTMETGQA